MITQDDMNHVEDRGFRTKPSFATSILGGGPHQNHIYTGIHTYIEVKGLALTVGRHFEFEVILRQAEGYFSESKRQPSPAKCFGNFLILNESLAYYRHSGVRFCYTKLSKPPLCHTICVFLCMHSGKIWHTYFGVRPSMRLQWKPPSSQFLVLNLLPVVLRLIRYFFCVRTCPHTTWLAF